ncbi:HAD family hydrolase [Marmoricola sp. OAE513]|uniref:HAD family hydrolase n=1 Tax=Marmoricola sp. OAE513 TaxID=2817894 RepID=UPI001AE78FEA
MDEPTRAVVVDIDGTLVDSNYLHVVAWKRAFQAHDVPVVCSRLHEVMGMGGDRLVEEIAGDEVERDLGDRLRDTWTQRYDELIDELRPLPRAAELLGAIEERGARVVLASSGKPQHTRHSLELLGLTEDSYPMVTSEEVDTTKPDPEIVSAALAEVGARTGLMIGDTVWDVKAAAGVGVPSVAVRTGGIAAAVLRDAGARAVYDDVAGVLDHLAEVLDLDTRFGSW